jgi:hypothetical protein
MEADATGKGMSEAGPSEVARAAAAERARMAIAETEARLEAKPAEPAPADSTEKGGPPEAAPEAAEKPVSPKEAARRKSAEDQERRLRERQAAEEKDNAERVDRMRRAGWSNFVAVMYLKKEPAKWETWAALLGLDHKIEENRKDANGRFDAVSESLEGFQRQVLAVFARQEVLHDHAKKLALSLASGLDGIVKRQDADLLLYARFVEAVVSWQLKLSERRTAYLEEVAKWEQLGWWQRRKTPRPKLSPLPEPPKLPDLPDSILIELPGLPEFPPLLSDEEMATLAADSEKAAGLLSGVAGKSAAVRRALSLAYATDQGKAKDEAPQAAPAEWPAAPKGA